MGVKRVKTMYSLCVFVFVQVLFENVPLPQEQQTLKYHSMPSGGSIWPVTEGEDARNAANRGNRLDPPITVCLGSI